MTPVQRDLRPATRRARTGPPGVIVAGMHRSATSLTTSVFVARGWSASGPLIGATRGNPRGHFEDTEIHRLHVDLLDHYGAGWDSAARLRELSRRPLELDAGEPQVSEFVRSLHAHEPWVWKNPRASLFLEGWGERLPDARVVLCVRSPASVADSLLRRGNRLGIEQGAPLVRIRRLVRALSLWRSYNKAAYRFAKSNPGRVDVVRIPADIDLIVDAQPGQFEPSLLAGHARTRVRVPAAFAVRSHVLHWRLRRLANRQRLRGLLAAAPAERG